MSASFYDLLKYAKTGIAAPDMTAYDKMRAVAMAGGKVKTLTGVPPLSFTGNGKPLISWSMKGNGQQQGTPTPDSPIMPTFCGVRTGNLFDKSDIQSGYEIINDYIRQNPEWGVSAYIPVEQGKYYIAVNTGGPVLEYETVGGTAVRAGKSITTGFYTPSETARFIRINFKLGKLADIMLNAGTEPLPYEPYGYKIPLTCAGQTVPVYLGQTQTVRRIKKLVLDGTESWIAGGSGAQLRFYVRTSNAIAGENAISQYFKQGSATIKGCCDVATSGTAKTIRFNNSGIAETVEEWNSYLAAQYAAGTPVVVWYVLATEQTGIVNEPLYKIGDYCDELHSSDAAVTIPTANGDNTLTVEGDLSPSSMTITYKS